MSEISSLVQNGSAREELITVHIFSLSRKTVIVLRSVVLVKSDRNKRANNVVWCFVFVVVANKHKTEITADAD